MTQKITLRPTIRRLRGAAGERLKKKGYRFVAVAEFPSGRAIIKQKPARTKKGAFAAVRTVAMVQTSPTAGGTSYSPTADRETWQYTGGTGRNGQNVHVNLY